MSNQTTDFEALGWAEDAKAYRESAPEAVITYLKEKCREYALSGDSRPSSLLTSALERAIETNDKALKGRQLDENTRQLAIAMYELGAAAKDLENELSFPTALRDQLFERKEQHLRSWAALQASVKAESEAKEMTRLMACAYAEQLWEADTSQEIRIGAMADKVWALLAADSELIDYRPERVETVKSWIRPVATKFPHSQKKGRKPLK